MMSVLTGNDSHVVAVAIECYFRLLSIPRASAYNALHPALFQQSIRIIKHILQRKLTESTGKRFGPEGYTV